MTKSEAKKKIEQLQEEINEHNYRYYVLAQPSISDYVDILNKNIEYKKANLTF